MLKNKVSSENVSGFCQVKTDSKVEKRASHRVKKRNSKKSSEKSETVRNT